DGLIGVNVQGQVLQIGVDECSIVPCITQKLQNIPLAVRIAGREKPSGSEDLFIQQFEAKFLAQNYGDAAKIAAIANWRSIYNTSYDPKIQDCITICRRSTTSNVISCCII
ncbi:MAG: hypothetical protein EZS28_045354, partial [Streblomastix strix]